MSDQTCVQETNGRSERLARLVELLGEAAQAGDFPDSATPVVELLADRLAAVCTAVENQQDRASGQADDANQLVTAEKLAEMPEETGSSAVIQPVARFQPATVLPAKVAAASWRLEMIEQCERAAREHKDPMRGSLAAFNAGLMRIALQSEEAVLQAGVEMQNPIPGSEPTGTERSPSTPIERLQRLRPMVDSHCRLIKLITRLSEMDARCDRPQPALPPRVTQQIPRVTQPVSLAAQPIPPVTQQAPRTAPLRDPDTAIPPAVRPEAKKSELDTTKLSPRASSTVTAPAAEATVGSVFQIPQDRLAMQRGEGLGVGG